MTRRPDWPERLAQTLESFRGRLFRWGETDCCMFVAEALWALTGEDPGASWRGAYRSELGAAILLRKRCGGGLERMAEITFRQLGLAEIAPPFAQRGDVLLFAGEFGGPALGIVGLSGTGEFLMPLCMAQISPNRCRRAWRL